MQSQVQYYGQVFFFTLGKSWIVVEQFFK
jgi:hypothetical protein